MIAQYPPMFIAIKLTRPGAGCQGVSGRIFQWNQAYRVLINKMLRVRGGLLAGFGAVMPTFFCRDAKKTSGSAPGRHIYVL